MAIPLLLSLQMLACPIEIVTGKNIIGWGGVLQRCYSALTKE